jgi:hypothetical protein
MNADKKILDFSSAFSAFIGGQNAHCHAVRLLRGW